MPSGPKQRIISYMPRKNSKDSAIVVALLKEIYGLENQAGLYNQLMDWRKTMLQDCLKKYDFFFLDTLRVWASTCRSSWQVVI